MGFPPQEDPGVPQAQQVMAPARISHLGLRSTSKALSWTKIPKDSWAVLQVCPVLEFPPPELFPPPSSREAAPLAQLTWHTGVTWEGSGDRWGEGDPRDGGLGCPRSLQIPKWDP